MVIDQRNLVNGCKDSKTKQKRNNFKYVACSLQTRMSECVCACVHLDTEEGRPILLHLELIKISNTMVISNREITNANANIALYLLYVRKCKAVPLPTPQK